MLRTLLLAGAVAGVAAVDSYVQCCLLLLVYGFHAIYLLAVRPYNVALVGGAELATTLCGAAMVGLSMAVMDDRGASDVTRATVGTVMLILQLLAYLAILAGTWSVACHALWDALGARQRLGLKPSPSDKFADTVLKVMARDPHILARKYFDRWMVRSLGVGLYDRPVWRRETEDLRRLLRAVTLPKKKVAAMGSVVRRKGFSPLERENPLFAEEEYYENYQGPTSPATAVSGSLATGTPGAATAATPGSAAAASGFGPGHRTPVRQPSAIVRTGTVATAPGHQSPGSQHESPFAQDSAGSPGLLAAGPPLQQRGDVSPQESGLTEWHSAVAQSMSMAQSASMSSGGYLSPQRSAQVSGGLTGLGRSGTMRQLDSLGSEVPTPKPIPRNNMEPSLAPMGGMAEPSLRPMGMAEPSLRPLALPQRSLTRQNQPEGADISLAPSRLTLRPKTYSRSSSISSGMTPRGGSTHEHAFSSGAQTPRRRGGLSGGLTPRSMASSSGAPTPRNGRSRSGGISGGLTPRHSAGPSPRASAAAAGAMFAQPQRQPSQPATSLHRLLAAPGQPQTAPAGQPAAAQSHSPTTRNRLLSLLSAPAAKQQPAPQ